MSPSQLPSGDTSAGGDTAGERGSGDRTQSGNPPGSDAENRQGGNSSGGALAGGPGGSPTNSNPVSSGDESEEEEEQENSPSAEETNDDNGDNDDGPSENKVIVQTDSSVTSCQMDMPFSDGPGQLISTSAGMELQDHEVVPPTRSGFPLTVDLVPGRYVIPPEYAPAGDIHLVGVPATAEDAQGGKFTQDGHGGPEALFLFEGLTLDDVDSLGPVTLAQDDAHEILLRVRSDELDERGLQDECRTLGVQRELASLLTVFQPERLALRVFGTVNTLKRLLMQYILLEKTIPSDRKDIVDKLMAVQSENAKLRNDYKLLGDLRNREMAAAFKEKDRLKEVHRNEVKKVYRECAESKRALQTD
ncbi:hypothetical protein PHYBOEH_001275, partial [Phytophthora boehmeriae]